MAGSTALIGGTASRLVVTDSSGNITTGVVQYDGTDLDTSTARVRVPAGTATSPAIALRTSTDQGFWFPGAGQMAYTSATQINPLVFSGSGNQMQIGSGWLLGWMANADATTGSFQYALGRSAGTGIEVNNGTAGTRSDLIVRNLHATGWIHANAGFSVGAHMVTVANDTNAGTANTEVLAGGGRGLYLIDCNDPQGCVIQLGTAVSPGTRAEIVNVSSNSNVLSVGNVTSVQHVQSLFTMSTNHVIGFMYTTNRSGASIWIETGRSGRAL